MQFERDIAPQYRESGADGLVGLKGYMCYSQDVATWHMHEHDLGNDVLIDKFGIAWMYTKCKIKIYKKADFSGYLKAETGMTKADKVRMHRDFRISRAGETFALGRMESCLYNIKENKLCRLEDIDYPDLGLDTPFDGLEFSKLKKDISGMKKIYSQKVLYTDLDKSRHMNNLHFVDLFLNAFPPEYFDKNFISEFELHFTAQAYYGNILDVYLKNEDYANVMAATDETGKCVALCRMVCE